MRFDVITLFPDEFRQSLQYGVLGRALARGQIELVCINPRDFAHDAYRRVDERVYGGGPGMVMLIEPLKAALKHALESDSRPAELSYLSPQGKPFTQAMAKACAKKDRMILLCGRYEGVDQRFIDNYVHNEISIGDFVLSGGEMAAMVVIDAITRLLPGVLNKSESAEQDSFEDGLLDCPHYTRPETCEEGSVPLVLQSGNHGEIAKWRRKQSLGNTWRKRPDLLAGRELSKSDAKLLEEYKQEFVDPSQ
jgi:tRNA (guanine37-N1)-methyltransferase